MTTPINIKRQQYRREIIKKQKEELFMSRRRQLIHNLMEGPNSVIALKQRTNTKEAFQFLRAKLESADYGATILKIVEQGLISTLMTYLVDAFQIHQALQIVCQIIGKKQPELNFTSTFFRHGILEHAIKYLQSDLKCASFCSYIISVFTNRSDDYCEILLANGKHQFLMQEFMRRLCNSRNPEQQDAGEGQKFYCNTLNALEHMLKIKKSTLDFTCQKMEIFHFALNIAKQRIFLKVSIGVLFESVPELDKGIVPQILPVVNQLLAEVRTEDKHLYNLFALIYIIVHKCGPVELNFKEFYKVGILSEKVQKPFVRVMEVYINSGPNHWQDIPKHEAWWQRLLTNPKGNQIHCLMLHFIDKLGITSEWVWRVFAAALSYHSPEVQHEMIMILSLRLRRLQYNQDTLTLMNKHRIITILQNISQHQGTSTIRQDAAHLLDYILGPHTTAMAPELETV